MKISLVGFMGTGKSTIGKLLAKKMGSFFLETDKLIEEKEGRKIAQIFSRDGEEYFRDLESKILEEALSDSRQFVLSTGGGIVLSARNRKLLKEATFPILLEASPETIYRRTKEEGNRPLLDTAQPQKKIKQMLARRNDFYHQFSHRVDTDHKTPEEITVEILEMVGGNPYGAH
ncbi:MAG: shikimate kinase [Halanaerobiaceae bacterium]